MSDSRQPWRNLRNYLAGQHVGATQDRALLQEVLRTLLCKAHLDRAQGVGRCRAGAGDYREVWAAVSAAAPDSIKVPKLGLDDSALEEFDKILAHVDLQHGHIDPFADVYEIFTGNGARGQEGQFFTPPNAVSLLVEMVDPQPGDLVVDPACGAGGFLAATSRHWSKARSGTNGRMVGIDKDYELVQLAALRMALLGESPSAVFCGDSLAWRPATHQNAPQLPDLENVDIVLTNPPFGKNIVAVNRKTQERFDLAYRWTRRRDGSDFVKTKTLLANVSPQVVFLERCISLLRPGGKLGMVLPESLLSSQRYQYVVQYLRNTTDIQAVIGMPENLFKVSGSTGTHTKTCLLVATKRKPNAGESRSRIFMAEVKWCGNDSRGRRTERDELPEIAVRFASTRLRRADHLGYRISRDDVRDEILAPRYYDPEPAQQLAALRKTHDLLTIGDLVAQGVLEIRSGHEVGKEAYGTGEIPFVRTSDISNWEVKLDPKHGVSQELYDRLSAVQDVREGDILMVRDGTYLIGTCAYISKYDQRIVYQSHLLKMRVCDQERISPFLLLAMLSSAPVKRQIAAKRFTMDIIDSIGGRVHELVLPLPKDAALRAFVDDQVRTVIRDRVEARELARQACLAIVGSRDAVTPPQDASELADWTLFE